jgi:putative addiction module component (TIGR02574 family)
VTQQTQRLLKEALGLPETERAELAAELPASLDQGEGPDAEAAWSAEIQQRLAALDSGQVRPIPWAEARRLLLGRS